MGIKFWDRSITSNEKFFRHKNTKPINCVIFAILMIWSFFIQAQDIKEVTIPKCTTPPRLDGEINDKEWENAAVLTDCYLPGKTELGKEHTRILLLHDNNWLYIACQCDNPGMGVVEQQIKDHDGPVCQDDSIEIFYDPGTGGDLYYQFMLNFANVRMEQCISKEKGKNTGWNIPWRSATKVSKNGWTGEVAIPLSLVGMKNRDAVRLNIGRNRIAVTLDKAGAAVSTNRLASTCAPLKGSFHEPESFLFCRGMEKTRIRNAFMPVILKAEVGGYEFQDDKRFYNVTATIRAYTRTPEKGSFLLQVSDQPEGMKETVPLTMPVQWEGKRTKTFTLKVPVDRLRAREVTLSLLDPVTKEVWQRFPLKDTSKLALMSRPLLDRNYYTSEQQAKIECRFGLPNEVLAKMSLTVVDENGKVLTKKEKLKKRIVLILNLKDISEGTHKLLCNLVDNNGRTLSTEPAELMKLAPLTGCEIKIDQFSNVILRNGKPFIPFGLWTSSLTAEDTPFFDRCATAGVNLIHLIPRDAYNFDQNDQSPADPLYYTDFLKEAGKRGLMVDYYFWNIDARSNYYPPSAKKWIGRDEKIDKISLKEWLKAQEKIVFPMVDRRIKILKNSPYFFGYYNIDEPNLGHPKINIPMAYNFYKHIKKVDPYHPVFTLYARHIPPEFEATACTDILAYDVYIYPYWPRSHNKFTYMSKMVDQVKRRADAARKITMMIPLAEAVIDTRRQPHNLTPAQQRCQSYLALIGGAKGLIYYHIGFATYTKAMWDMISRIGNELKTLTPALVTPPLQCNIKYERNGEVVKDNGLTEVRATLLREPNGEGIILCANSQPFPVKTQFTFQDEAKLQKAQSLFKGTELLVTENQFTEELKPYGVRVYRLNFENPLTEDSKIQLKVQMTPFPERALKEPTLPRNPLDAYADKKNLAPNGSFEEQTVSVLPDYFRPVYYLGSPLAGKPDEPWNVVSTNPYHGKKCLHMRMDKTTWRGPKRQRPIHAGVYGVCYPPISPKDQPAVLSAYMRAAKNGQRVKMHVYGKTKIFKLTTDWKRYWMPCTVTGDPERKRLLNMGGMAKNIWIQTMGDSEIWVDAVQFEVGVTEPTPFTTD